VKGLADQLGNPLGLVDLRHPFGERPEHAAEIDLLEGLALDLVARDLADEQDHRRRILHRGVDRDRGVGGARPAGDEADARPARQLAIGLGHVAGAAFLAAGDQPDGVARVVERVEHRQEAFARHAEGEVDAMALQGIDQDLAAAAAVVGLGHGRRCFLRANGRLRP